MPSARKSPEIEAAERQDRLGKILAERVRTNTLEWRKFKMRQLDRVWEFVKRKPMPEPDLTLEPYNFRFWLGTTSGVTAQTMLEDWLREALSRAGSDVARSRARRLLSASRAGQRRRARLAVASVAWADRQAIRDIYAECRMRNAVAGSVVWHVDHVYPLQGTRVSGLHVVENLRIIKAKANMEKRNRAPIDA